MGPGGWAQQGDGIIVSPVKRGTPAWHPPETDHRRHEHQQPVGKQEGQQPARLQAGVAGGRGAVMDLQSLARADRSHQLADPIPALHVHLLQAAL